MAAPGVAVPGSVVAIGSQASPAGAQGIQGPAGPSAVSANANNKATLGSDSLVLVQGTAAGVAATTHAQTVSGDDPQLTNARTPTGHHTTHEHGGSDPVSITYSDLLSLPATFAPAAHEASHVTGSDQIPLASSSTKGLLNQTSGNTTDFIDGTNNSQALQPVIWNATRRVFQAIGNPTFEVDQRNVSGVVNLPAGSVGPFVQDRWSHQKVAATMALSVQAATGVSGILIPGTSFRISQANHFINLITQQATLAAGEIGYMLQTVEGPRFRELTNDVHSISVLASTNVAGGLKFGLALRDPGSTRSLVKLCTITSPNVWQLITLPNLPIWAAGGNFSSAAGAAGYLLSVCYACGTTYTAPANDTWQNGNFLGAVGQDNLGSKPVGSNLTLAVIQHEPGALCTTPIDCPFTQNYDECLRYYQKTYAYGTAVGAINVPGYFDTMSYSGGATSQFNMGARFVKPMAKTPTVVCYNYSTGAANSVADFGGTARAVSTVSDVSDKQPFGSLALAVAAVGGGCSVHYTADTGW